MATMSDPFFKTEESAGALIYQDGYTSCHLSGNHALLNFHSKQAAGAIGLAQGESLQQGIKALQGQAFKTLHLTLNSAGAHFNEPLEGLFHLNAIAESLWQVRNQGITIHVHCPDWLYGGMAMILASVAHEITLHSQAHMGLFGPRVSGGKQPRISARARLSARTFTPDPPAALSALSNYAQTQRALSKQDSLKEFK